MASRFACCMFVSVFLFSNILGLGSYWAQGTTPTPLPGDSNRDGVVDQDDLFLTVTSWHKGQKYTPTPNDVTPEITIMLPGEVPLVLVHIPVGDYLMGRYPNEQDSNAEEEPRHRVYIYQDFYLGKYELTKRQWQAVMGTTPWSGQDYVFSHPDSPANYVFWDDSQALVNELNQMGKGTFKLPSEAEWEYACRAGTETRFYWGDDPEYILISDYAWWDGNANSPGEKYAHLVGQKLPNYWGLYDMSGNVMEWCQDRWHANYEGAPPDGMAWESGSTNSRVLRGGTWVNVGLHSRSGARYGYGPFEFGHMIGFRLAWTP